MKFPACIFGDKCLYIHPNVNPLKSNLNHPRFHANSNNIVQERIALTRTQDSLREEEAEAVEEAAEEEEEEEVSNTKVYPSISLLTWKGKQPEIYAKLDQALE